MIFRQALPAGVFPSEWRKGNIVLIHKKSNKQNIRNYLPVSLIPICGKIFERLIFNKMFNYFYVDKLTRSGFQPCDSCINQLLSITHKIYTSFDNGLEEVRGVLPDISKAFDKLWHKRLIFKLK